MEVNNQIESGRATIKELIERKDTIPLFFIYTKPSDKEGAVTETEIGTVVQGTGLGVVRGIELEEVMALLIRLMGREMTERQKLREQAEKN